MYPRLQDYRTFQAVSFAACVGLLAYAYYAQYYLYLEPCPLCILQRVVVLLLGLNALIALIHAPKTRVRRVYAINGAGLGALGCLVAGRHVYLQSLPPDKAPECGPGLEYLLDTLPFNQAIMKIFTGSGECASVDWTLAGLSMPAWVLVAMVLFCLLSVGSMWMKPIDDEGRTNHI